MGVSALYVSAAAVLTGCGSGKEESKTETAAAEPANCRDISGVSKEDLTVREKLAYVNESPIPDNQCHNCNLYLPPGKDKKCGGCMLFKGPVEADGYCTYWAPKI
jgi:hypothetical protein